MSTLREIIESQKRLADSVFDQSAAANRQVVSIDRLSVAFERLNSTFERLIVPFERLSKDIYDMKNDREMDGAKIDLALGRLNTDLAVLVDNVKDAQGDVKALAREVTGTHILPPRERKPAVVAIIEAFERLPTTTKFVVFVLVLAAALSGWLTHIVGG